MEGAKPAVMMLNIVCGAKPWYCMYWYYVPTAVNPELDPFTPLYHCNYSLEHQLCVNPYLKIRSLQHKWTLHPSLRTFDKNDCDAIKKKDWIFFCGRGAVCEPLKNGKESIKTNALLVLVFCWDLLTIAKHIQKKSVLSFNAHKIK